jgi:hypothetical protein
LSIGAELDLAAEVIGFISSAALAWQAYRLISHQGTAHELRDTADQQAEQSPSLAQRAHRNASALDELISRWDKVDQRLVFIGLLGLVLSFGLKLASLAA